MIMTEGSLQFDFGADAAAMKFDDTKFYRDSFAERMPEGKGVDFIVLTKDRLMLIEVKNCTGYESENIWRTDTHHREEDIQSSGRETRTPETFDIEVAKKVAGTLACMAGAVTYNEKIEADVKEFAPYWKEFQKIKKREIRLSVILFLEGDFPVQSRNKKMIMDSIKKKLNFYLKWLNAEAAVVDSTSCHRFFVVKRK